jgi:hypothetical protein
MRNGMKDVPQRARIDFRETPEQAPIHDAMIARHVATAAWSYTWLERLLGGNVNLPGLGVVHVLVETTDGQLIEGRRSSQSAAHPGVWAPTFEEQIKADEVVLPDALIEIIRRGLAEEYHLALPPRDIEMKSASIIVEWPVLNLGICCHVAVTRPSADFLKSQDDPQPELIERRASARDKRLRNLVQSEIGYWSLDDADKWHPTSAVRLALLRRSLAA